MNEEVMNPLTSGRGDFKAVGLFTRLSALCMTGFVAVMSLVDHFGHSVALGNWFDGAPDAVLLDQRLFWILALVLLMLLGGGRLSVDRFLERRMPSPTPGSTVDVVPTEN